MILQSPGGGHGNALQYSCLEHPHGQRSLVGYIPWGHKELDMIEWISTASTISLLALYLDNSLIWKDICTPTFIAALFTIAKTRKQPKYPSTDEWIKMCSVYIEWNTTQPEKEWNNGICSTWMDLEMFILSEVSQTEKDKCLMISLICDICKKWYERIYLQNKTDTQT